ncbi:hypothetical protein [Winogradskyella sp. MIT101101]|uniref:hypothetical protein n=1 Tax=Winogradskyella sp. MIT101101 TaxID=3098297 RepID=UPI00399AB4C8
MKSTDFLILPVFISLIIFSCNNEDLEDQNNTEFIEYTIDGGEPVTIFEDINAIFYPNNQDFSSPVLDIFTFTNDYNTCFRIRGALHNPNYLGTYDNHDFQENDTGFSMDDFDWVNCSDAFNISSINNNITYNLTVLGEVGEYIDINFSGDYEDYDGNPHTITGIVHVIRDN